jgi:ComF family protein
VGAFHYDGPVKRLLHRLKYEGHSVSARALAGLAVEALRGKAFAESVERVVPVPMHWKRRIQRGYNQSERIASPLAKGLGKPWCAALVKTRASEPQVDLSREARHRNPVGTFAVRRGRFVAGRTVLLVDDVMTTAATVSECARVLKEAGATSVVAFAVARQA